MAGNLLFYYFGDDEAYFRTLQGEFRSNTRLAIDFKRIYETEEKKIQSLFLKVFRDHPTCVFIDFSKNTQDYIHLARIISRTPIEHKLITVGLVDYLSPPEVLRESIATGVSLTHIKSAETYDVIFDVAKLIDPKEIGEHGFANAALKEDWEAGLPVKVGYIHPEGLHFETDFRLSKGDRIRLNHCWVQQKIVPSREVFITNTSTKNLFYHFKNAVDAEFLFIDEFLPPEGMEEERIQEKKADREEAIRQHKKLLLRWIDDNVSRSLEKKAKVMVVDREFKFYDDQERSDKHQYTIRALPFLEDIGTELDRLEPQVIAFALEKKDATNPLNTNEKLVELTRALKVKYAHLSPFVVVFNAELSSKEMQERFDYPHIMASKTELSVEVLVRMAEIYDKKLSDKKAQTADDLKKVFIRKTNSASLAEIMIPITVTKISETDMTFQSEIDIPIGSNLHLTSPVDMFINVQPGKGQNGKVPEYTGLIHSLGEEEKKNLRKFVNSVFFRDHDANKVAELDEFKKLNEAKLQERLEKEKAEKEKLEAAAQAEAGETKDPSISQG